MSDTDDDNHLFYTLCEQVKAIVDHTAQKLDARDLEEDDMAECPALSKLGCAALVELLRARAPVLANEVRHATRHAKRKLPSTTDVSFVARNHRNTARALAAFERRNCARPNKRRRQSAGDGGGAHEDILLTDDEDNNSDGGTEAGERGEAPSFSDDVVQALLVQGTKKGSPSRAGKGRDRTGCHRKMKGGDRSSSSGDGSAEGAPLRLSSAALLCCGELLRLYVSEAFVRARLQCTNDVEGAGVEVQVQHVERMSPQLFLDLF